VRSRRLPGRWTVPAVALDGATTGLSADGRTLVLVRPEREFPAAKTSLGVVDARRLTVRRTIVLSGAFTVDAVSPDGRTVYVIQYADSVLDYRVRALDARSGRLAARDVVDPRQPGERMAGLPLARASSPDGRWAYTLYGGGDETFVHALDTVGRTAACIDIDALPPDADLSGVRLRVLGGARSLEVRDAGRLVATVDARTFAVHEAVAGSARVRAARESGVPGGGVPWTAILLAGAIGLAALAAALVDRRRGRSAPPRTT